MGKVCLNHPAGAVGLPDLEEGRCNGRDKKFPPDDLYIKSFFSFLSCAR